MTAVVNPNSPAQLVIDNELAGCPFCGHAPHAEELCEGRSPCDCGLEHECACSFPDPSNYAEVPARA